MPAAVREEAEAHKAAGNEAFKGRQFAEAVQAYSRAIDLDPGCAVYYSNRAQAYLQAGRPLRKPAPACNAEASGMVFSVAREGRTGHHCMRKAQALLQRACRLSCRLAERYCNNCRAPQAQCISRGVHACMPVRARKIMEFGEAEALLKGSTSTVHVA